MASENPRPVAPPERLNPLFWIWAGLALTIVWAAVIPLGAYLGVTGLLD